LARRVRHALRAAIRPNPRSTDPASRPGYRAGTKRVPERKTPGFRIFINRLKKPDLHTGRGIQARNSTAFQTGFQLHHGPPERTAGAGGGDARSALLIRQRNT